MSTLNSHELWQGIVAATSGLDSDFTALRVPIWVALQAPQISMRGRARDILSATGQLISANREKSGVTPSGGVLFCFAHRTPSNMNNLLPVAREAHKRGLMTGIVTAGDYREHLREFATTVPIISIRELTAQLGVGDRLKALARIRSVFRQISRSLSNHRPDIKSVLASRRVSILRAAAESVFCGVAVAELLDRWSPKCVISTSDFWPLEHQLCRQASEKGIPSVVVQHGTIDRFWWPFAADLYSMWGDADVNRMKGFGAPAEKLTAMGMPATDEIFRYAETTCNELVENAQRPVCLILSNAHGSPFEPEVFEKYRHFLTNAVNTMPSVTWKIKLHPSENDSFYRSLGPAVLNRLHFHNKQVSLREAVRDANVVTTIYSTAGLEAMILSRPLVVGPVNPRVLELAPWPATGGGTYFDSAESFQVQFDRLVSDRDYREQHLAQQCEFLASNFSNRGYASEKIVNLLERPLEWLSNPRVAIGASETSSKFMEAMN